MANMYNINALSYKPSENPEWFTRAIFGGRLIAAGIITVLTGIKGEELLNQIDLENRVLQVDNRDCSWTPNQLLKLSEKRAKVKDYKINMEQCIDALEQKRTAFLLKAGATNDDGLPPELEAATLELIAIGLSNEIEELIVGGDEAASPDEFDGMVTQAKNSTEAAHIEGAVLTKANVLQAFEDGYNEVKEDVLQAEETVGLFAFVSYNARRLIRTALASVGNQTIGLNWTLDDTDKKNPVIYYLGTQIVPVKGIGKNDILFAASNNLMLCTDLMDDLENIELGQYPKPNENKVWIKGRLRLGFVIPFEDELVLVSPDVEDRTAAGRLLLEPNVASLTVVPGDNYKTMKVTYNPDADGFAGIEVNGTGVEIGTPADFDVAGLYNLQVTVIANEVQLSVVPSIAGKAWQSSLQKPQVFEIKIAYAGLNRYVTIPVVFQSEIVTDEEIIP